MIKEILQLVPWGWIVALILGWLALRAFKPSIHGFLQRANKFSAGKFAAEASPSQQIAEGKDSAANKKQLLGTYEEIQATIEPFRFGAVKNTSKEIKQRLEELQLTPDQLKQLMADTSAVIVMVIDFENTFSLIYGSQIVALQDLNSVPGRRAEEARGFYERGVKASPELYQNYSFDQWLGFMKSKGLINQDGDVVGITDAGRDFLRYMVQTGKPPFKPG